MPNLDDLLAGLVADGKNMRRKRGRPKGKAKAKPTLESVKTDSALPTRRKIKPGQFEDTAVVASYKKRVCVHCGNEELSEFPRIFLLRTHIRIKETRIYKRLFRHADLHNALTRLPLKIELYKKTEPGCKHCIKEIASYAKPSQGYHQVEHTNQSRALAPCSLYPPRTFQGPPVELDGIQSRIAKSILLAVGQ